MKIDFSWPCENFAQSCEMLQEDEIDADAFSTSHNHAKLLKLMRNCIFPYFLVKKPSEDLLDDAKCPLDLGL